MTVDKDLVPRSFRIDLLAKSIAVSAVLSAACLIPFAAEAQSSAGMTTTSTTVTTPANGMTTTDTTVTATPPVNFDANVPPAINYGILANQSFNYDQIKRAQAYGLTDEQIGRAIAIADRASVRPGEVLDKVRAGWTFQSIASYYGLEDRWRDPSYTQKVEDYMTAYQATGRGALEMASNDTGNTMSTGTLNGGAPATMSTPDIIQTAEESGQFSDFVRAVRRAGLTSTLEGAGPFTVFAPTDSAFDKIPRNELRSLMRNRSELRQVLEYHVIPANISAATAMAMTTPTSPATLEGEPLQVTTNNGTVMINNATVTQADIQASNGVIHAVDTVLLPPNVQLVPTVDMPLPGTATAPGEDSKTPTPNAVNGTGPNLNAATPDTTNGGNSTATAPGQDSKTTTPNNLNGTAPAGSVPLAPATPSTNGMTTTPNTDNGVTATPSVQTPTPPVTAMPNTNNGTVGSNGAGATPAPTTGSGAAQ